MALHKLFISFLLACSMALPCCPLCFAAAQHATETKQQIVVTPQPTNSTAAAVVNGVQEPEQDFPRDPEVVELEDRIMRYKFVLETLGFTLVEFMFSPDKDFKTELTFEGRMNTTGEKLQELADKFPDEGKLFSILRELYEYNKHALTNYAAYKVVLRLSKPVDITVYYKKF